MQAVVTLAGVAVALEAEGAARWAAVDALFGGCPRTDGPGQLTVRFGADPPPAPTGSPAVSWSDVDLWFTDQGAVTRHASGIVAGRSGDDIVVGGTADAATLPRAFRRSVQHVLASAMADHDRYALHAALVARDGGAIVVIGDTGAGKSTVAVAALAHGWSVLTDDIAWLSPAGAGGVEVAGFPKPLHVPSDLLDEVPADATKLPDDHRDRLVVHGAVTRDQRSRPLVGIVVVEHGEEAGRLVPFDCGPPLVTMLMRSYPLQASPRDVRRFFPLAVRTSGRPAVVLEHAADPRQRLDRAAAMLDEAWIRFVQTNSRAGQ